MNDNGDNDEKTKSLKTWVEIFWANSPEGNLMGGNFPDVNFPGGGFPDTIFIVRK